MVFFAEILGRKKKKKLTKKEKTIWNIVRFQYTRLTYRTVNEKLEFEIKTVYHSTHKKWASLMAQQVKNPPVMLETQNLWFKPRVRKILGMRKMAAHSIILAWKIPWTEEPGGLQSTGSQRVRHDWATKHKHTWNDIHGNKSDKTCMIYNRKIKKLWWRKSKNKIEIWPIFMYMKT